MEHQFEGSEKSRESHDDVGTSQTAAADETGDLSAMTPPSRIDDASSSSSVAADDDRPTETVPPTKADVPDVPAESDGHDPSTTASAVAEAEQRRDDSATSESESTSADTPTDAASTSADDAPPTGDTATASEVKAPSAVELPAATPDAPASEQSAAVSTGELVTTGIVTPLPSAAPSVAPPSPPVATAEQLESMESRLQREISTAVKAVTKLQSVVDLYATSDRDRERTIGQITEMLGMVTRGVHTVQSHIAEIASRMTAFENHLNKLTHYFNDRFREDKLKQQAFDRLYDELKQYKDQFVFQSQKPVFLDLILLYDDVGRMVKSANDAEWEKKLGFLQEMIREILYRRDVEVIDETPATFDKNCQKALRRVTTGDPAQDFAVKELVRDGFQWDGKVLRPQEVIVYRYDPNHQDGDTAAWSSSTTAAPETPAALDEADTPANVDVPSTSSPPGDDETPADRSATPSTESEPKSESDSPDAAADPDAADGAQNP